MKKKLLALLFVLTSLNFYAQINYEKSYFIDNNGTKTECYIKDKDKNDNPTSFLYKLHPDESQVIKADIKNIKEFKVGDVLKYERATVKLDTSTNNINALNENREPEWKEVTIFLETLVDSETSLFEYKNGNLKRFFYKKGNETIEQLIYKKYIVNEELVTRLGVNNDFQKQLSKNLNCDNKSINDFLKLKYAQKDLINFFTSYNNCKNNKIVDFGKKKVSGSINLKIQAGVTSSSLSLYNSITAIDADFGKKTNLTYGAEFEWVLPFNRNKWSLFLAPIYNSYENSTTVTDYNRGPFQSDTVTESWKASLSHLDIAAGVRYSIFINDNSRIFITGSYIVSSVLDSDIHDVDHNAQLEAKFRNRAAGGVGYSFKNKFNVELKYSSTNIFDNYVFYSSHYNLTSLVFGYTIFDTKKKK